ncbi:AAA family ATPase, CDC48 subfamily [Thermoplasmatales archaeon SCGC AB-539-N05]|nr:AAA family ATPase, CDC48 subfamily [Thermoplasmatales archaeon SCGC AB-539-N05]
MDKTEVFLKVAESFQQDVGYGRARIDSQTRVDLNLSIGDVIKIEGTKNTAVVVWRAHPNDEGKKIVRIDNLTRKNAGTGLGDRVKIRKVEVKNAKEIVLAPLISEGQQVQFGGGIENLIKKGLLKRPVTNGDTIIIPGIALFGSALPFSIIKSVPGGVVSITEDTALMVKEEAVRVGDLEAPQVSYEDIGGLHDEILRVREMIELPLKHPELFDRLGIDPPKGVLLHGPPGTGKTLIAKAVANESGASFYTINGPEIMSKFYGQSEENLRKIFEEAEKNAPSIIFIDEIDAIAPKRSEVHGEVERRVVSQMLTLMDGLKGRGKLIVIGATNIPDSIDPALRRPGRFDREIRLGVPDRKGRKEILQIHTRGMPKGKKYNVNHLADITYGFVGADLDALAREAAMHTLRRYLPKIDLEKPIPTEILEEMEVTMDDFRNALKEIEPSAMREFFVEVPKVSWKDVGGLENIKQNLREAVDWPLTKPEAFKRMGISPPRGILLYGPPGTGKTLLAKAVANESNANFISIKGPEVLSKWVGESEKAVRELFKKARQVSPTIVFLDELDAIAPRRGMYSGSHVTESVVNQLLTSIDGLEGMEGVVVIGATNRPDIIDPGLLRPGRFDRLILTPAPDKKALLEILKIHTKGMPLAKDVKLQELTGMCGGHSGADIEALCREAAILSLREDMKAKKVEKKHFMEAMKSVRASITPDVIKYYKRVGEEIGAGVAKKDKRETDIPYM